MGELEDKINSVLGDPDQLKKITKMAQSFMAGSGTAEKPDSGGAGDKLGDMFKAFGGGDGEGGMDIDPAMISRITRLMSSGGAEKKQERALLEAMKPYMSEKRRSKMDKALRIAKLAGIAKLAMGELGVDGDDKPLSG